MLGGKNPKRDAVGPVSVADQRPRSPYAFVTKRRQGSVVEGPTSVDVPHTDGYMSDHSLYPCMASPRDRPGRSRRRREARLGLCPALVNTPLRCRPLFRLLSWRRSALRRDLGATRRFFVARTLVAAAFHVARYRPDAR